MKQRFIELTKENYRQYLPIDIMAFSYSVPGAMGERGAIIIVSSNKQLFHFNYVDENFEFEETCEICPVLKDCQVYLFSCDVPKGWSYLSLGFGNHLIIKDILLERFKEHAKDVLDTPHLLYGKWLKAALKALNNPTYGKWRKLFKKH